MRNLIFTVNKLPSDLDIPVTIHLNDLNALICHRNMIFLYLLLTNGENAIDLVIQLWYSIAITESQSKVFAAAMDNILDKGMEISMKFLMKGGNFSESAGKSQLITSFPSASWRELANTLKNKMSMEEALDKRSRVMLSNENLITRQMETMEIYENASISPKNLIK